MSDPFKGLKSALGRNIRALRLRHGMSQELLAANAGVDRKRIGELERAVANPSLEVIVKVAMALQVRPGELLDGHFRED